MKPLFVIMVTYRRFEEFRRTCESLFPTLPHGSKVAIVVNGDIDTEYQGYLKVLPQLTAPGAVTINVLQTGTNNGWGSAMNEGLYLYRDWEDYEYVLESNNDVEYEPDWFQKAKAIMETWPEIGILGLWSHPYHGLRGVMNRNGLSVNVKDDMPATAWLMRSKDLDTFLPFPAHGPCKTRGGNGEDVAFRDKVQKRGWWIAGPTEDLAHHIDGYGIPDLGKPNPAYE